MRKVWALVLAVTLAMASMCNVVWAADAGETEAAAQTAVVYLFFVIFTLVAYRPWRKNR